MTKTALLKADKPPTHFYRYLYDTIGAEYCWVDRKKLTPQALAELLHDPLNLMFVLYTEGSPAGMAELDLRKSGTAKSATAAKPKPTAHAAIASEPHAGPIRAASG